ncbi:ADOP family duplicated permease [Dokdonella sp.]|uniref:ADOP family duplicated permease n=1 Tax=Dokdonella sp. TaxID=2291710 RepID=UPI002604F1BD|nr:ADOP family duplicated permease [Dokdonella sp.]
MNGLQDLKFAVRSLRAHAGTAAFAAVTLALGLGAALAIYAVVDAVLLRDLPYPHADRLVQMRELSAEGKPMALAYPNYADLATVDAFDATTFYYGADGPVSNGSVTRRAYATYAGGDFFRVLATAPQLGRTFDAREHERVAVISHALWQGLLQGRPDAVGSAIDVGGETATIVGVMPAGFDFPAGSDVWTPFLEDPGSSRTAHNWSALGRLRDDATLAQARLAAGTLATRLAQEHGEKIDLRGFGVTPLAEAIAAPVRTALLLLGAGTLFLLLIAVTNAANLLLAMNGSRSRELAVRAALGASRMRLARQVFAEGALIAATACVLAVALAWAAIRALVHGGNAHLPRAAEVGVGAGTIGLAVAAALAIAIVTTLAVLLGRRRRSDNEELRESGRSQSPARAHLRLRAALLVGQTALTTALLVGAGLLGRSFLALLAVDPGFDADSAMTVQLSRPFTRDAATAAETARRYDALIGELRQVPGVTAVGGVNALPLGDGANGAFWDGAVTDFMNGPKPIGYAEFRVASTDYFKAAGIPLLAGRAFDERDRADGGQVAVISAAAARSTWGGADPIGRRIQYGNMDGDARVLTIVGVVGDVRERSLESAPMGAVYVNLAQRPLAAAEFNLVVRSSLPLPALAPTLRDLLDRRANDIPHALAPLAEMRAAALADRRFSLVLFGAFAATAFALAVGGLYGLMAFSVGQRGHEFALRQALGATRRRIAHLVFGNGLAIGGIGVAAGIALSLAAAHALGSRLYGVGTADPPTLGAVAALLLGTILAACFFPARRACAAAPRDILS